MLQWHLYAPPDSWIFHVVEQQQNAPYICRRQTKVVGVTLKLCFSTVYCFGLACTVTAQAESCYLPYNTTVLHNNLRLEGWCEKEEVELKNGYAAVRQK